MEIETRSSSLATAEVRTPIVLRETTTTRLVFAPRLIDNPRNAEAAVEGALVFQRKGPDDAWEEIKGLNPATLKKGEWTKVLLHTEATLRLYETLHALYKLYEEQGVPMGERRFVSVEGSLAALIGLGDAELEGAQELGARGLARLLRWASDQGHIAHSLRVLPANQVYALADLSGLQALKRALDVWDGNQDNDKEEFWQHQLLEKVPVLLQQLFAYPVVVMEDKAYVGGKRIDNKGGRLADFLLMNKLTRNTALIEIKTPCTGLLGGEYRDDVFPPSHDLVGATTQVLSYRDSLSKDFYGLAHESGGNFEVWQPPCIVLAGHTKRELIDRPRRRCFELYRRGLHGVEVVSFDELFERGKNLVKLLEDGGQAPENAEEFLDDLPF